METAILEGPPSADATSRTQDPEHWGFPVRHRWLLDPAQTDRRLGGEQDADQQIRGDVCRALRLVIADDPRTSPGQRHARWLVAARILASVGARLVATRSDWAPGGSCECLEQAAAINARSTPRVGGEAREAVRVAADALATIVRTPCRSCRQPPTSLVEGLLEALEQALWPATDATLSRAPDAGCASGQASRGETSHGRVS